MFGGHFEIGVPINDAGQSGAYFDRILAKSAPFCSELARRFSLAGKRVLSIASGYGAEELLLASRGVAVDCIEVDTHSCDVARAKWKDQPGADRLRLFQCAKSEFDDAVRYDLIYTSGPSDWMHSDYRDGLPSSYPAFLGRFAAERSVFVARIYGGAFQTAVLKSSWLPKRIGERLRTLGDFRLREYWLSEQGSSATIVCTRGIGDVPPGDFSTASNRDGQRSRLAASWPAEVSVSPSPFERTVPYLIAGNRIGAAIARRAGLRS